MISIKETEKVANTTKDSEFSDRSSLTIVLCKKFTLIRLCIPIMILFIAWLAKFVDFSILTALFNPKPTNIVPNEDIFVAADAGLGCPFPGQVYIPKVLLNQ